MFSSTLGRGKIDSKNLRGSTKPANNRQEIGSVSIRCACTRMPIHFCLLKLTACHTMVTTPRYSRKAWTCALKRLMRKTYLHGIQSFSSLNMGKTSLLCYPPAQTLANSTPHCTRLAARCTTSLKAPLSWPRCDCGRPRISETF